MQIRKRDSTMKGQSRGLFVLESSFRYLRAPFTMHSEM
jgi:hypothetical protein